MNAQNKQAILDEIDATLRTIGQKDYEQFRSTMTNAGILLENAAIWSKRFGGATRKELEDAIENTPDAEAETKLRLMLELRNYLPTLGTILIQAATRVFPRQVGGAPRKLKDRDAMRQACNLVLGLIATGKSESQAKKLAAHKLDVSLQTINRNWKQRAIITEPSIEEFLLQVFKSLSVVGGSPIIQIDNRLPQPIGEHTQEGIETPYAEPHEKKQPRSNE